MSATGSFQAHRPHLFGVAYRMLGSVTEAEDVVQEAWLRWSQVDADGLDDERAFLATIVSRLALDRLRSAQRRREAYVGPWLPEPLLARPGGARSGGGPSPEEAAELSDSLTFAFLTLLDELDPEQRAVLLLHDVFGYRFREVAAVVDRSEASCRQIASRARRRLRSPRVTSLQATGAGRRPDAATVDRFLLAMATGDVGGVLAELAPDVVLVSDGGPNHHAARRPVLGADRVSRLLVNLGMRMPSGATVELVDLNGEPGVIVFVDGQAHATLGLAGGPAGIERVWVVRNPEKLSHLTAGGPASPTAAPQGPAS